MKPERMEVLTQNIPLELLRGKKWICWRWEKRNGNWTKPLYNPKSGSYAKSDDPSTWTTFAEAWRTYESGDYDGIGFVLCKADGFCGIDYDKVRNPNTGEINSEALAKIRAINSYTEISPSQQGLKTIAKAKLPDRDRQSEHYSFYSDKRYFTITGHVFDGISNAIEKRQEQVVGLYRELFPLEEETVTKNENNQPNHNIDDSRIIEKALAAKDGGKFKTLWQGDFSDYPSQSEADQALCNKLAFWVGPDSSRIDALFHQSGLMRDKWRDREDYRTRTIERAIAGITETYKPNCSENGADAPEMEQTQSLDFPCQVMTGMAGDFANLYSSYLEVPGQFLYVSCLSCLGAVVADRLTLASEISPQPRLFVVLLGESADDRKSTALIKSISFYKEAVEDFAVCWGVGSAEGLQERLKKDNRLVLCFDEFKSFVGKCQAQGSVLLPCVNSLFELNHYENYTKNSHISIPNAYLIFMAASTIQTYENTWNPQFTDIGFNNRLFLVPGTGERKHSFPAKIPDREKYLLKQKLAEILRHVGDSLELDITPDAKELYHRWYMNMEKSIHSKRLDTYALRLMALLTANELKSEIDTDIVEKATALCNWQLQVRMLHDPIGADNVIATMEEKIRRVLNAKGPLKDWELRQFTNVKQKGLWYYDSAKKNLMKAGELKMKNKVLSLTF